MVCREMTGFILMTWPLPLSAHRKKFLREMRWRAKQGELLYEIINTENRPPYLNESDSLHPFSVLILLAIDFCRCNQDVSRNYQHLQGY